MVRAPIQFTTRSETIRHSLFHAKSPIIQIQVEYVTGYRWCVRRDFNEVWARPVLKFFFWQTWNLVRSDMQYREAEYIQLQPHLALPRLPPREIDPVRSVIRYEPHPLIPTSQQSLPQPHLIVEATAQVTAAAASLLSLTYCLSIHMVSVFGRFRMAFSHYTLHLPLSLYLIRPSRRPKMWSKTSEMLWAWLEQSDRLWPEHVTQI